MQTHVLRQSIACLAEETLHRIAGMVAVPVEDADISEARPHRDVVEAVLVQLWRYMGCYRLGEQDTWYLMDEIGSAIRHSSEPGIVCVPFIHIQRSADPANPAAIWTPYSVAWLIKSLNEGDSVERDFLPYISTPIDRVARLVDWLGEDNTDEDLVEQLITGAAHFNSILAEKNDETRMHLERKRAMGLPLPPSTTSRRLTVWTSPDDPLRLRHASGGLSHPSFELLSPEDDPGAADIVWTSEPIRGTPRAWANPTEDADADANCLQMVNQFPYEGAFHNKGHLAREIARCIGQPAWWNPSYDLETHFPIFVGEFIRRRRLQQDGETGCSGGNVWIVKPAQGTRSMGHIVTDSLVRITRHLEVEGSTAGGGGGLKRVAQLYVQKPLLWRGNRKFDMRYMVAVRSFGNPSTEIYVHNSFWSRIANKPHVADEREGEVWEDRERSLTAMWVLDGVQQQDMIPDCAEISSGIEEMYPNVQWSAVTRGVHIMLRELFEGVSAGQPNGMACRRARALYGVDVIVEVTREGEDGTVLEVQPKLLEVTFIPSNAGVNPLFTKQYPYFSNDIFGCLFLGEHNNMTRLL